MIKITDVEYKGRYRLELTFNNGQTKIVDLENHLAGKIYQALKDIKLFKQYGLINGTIEWVNGADFAPEYLYTLAEKQEESSISN